MILKMILKPTFGSKECRLNYPHRHTLSRRLFYRLNWLEAGRGGWKLLLGRLFLQVIIKCHDVALRIVIKLYCSYFFGVSNFHLPASGFLTKNKFLHINIILNRTGGLEEAAGLFIAIFRSVIHHICRLSSE